MNSVELYQLDINNRSNRIGGYAPINSIVPSVVQRNPEVMGFPVSQERREPPALASLLPPRRPGEVGRGCPRVGRIRNTPLPNPSGHPTTLEGVTEAPSEEEGRGGKG